MKTFLCILALICLASCFYDKQFSKNLNRFSAVTHCNQSLIQSWSCKICTEGQKLLSIKYIYNKFTNVMGYAGYWPEKNKIVLSMRGTVDIKNWIQNFNFETSKYSKCTGCLIHDGFYFDYLSVSNLIQTSVKALIQMYPSARLIVTGSSLGGALAVIAGLQLQLSLGLVDELHVFGCPRVGNPQLAHFINAKIPQVYRVIHNKDIVPHVPLLNQNFYHPSFEVLFDEEMQSYTVCKQGEDPDCSDSYYPNLSVNDHTTYWYKPVGEDVCTPK